MIVSELIEKLQALPQDAEVLILDIGSPRSDGYLPVMISEAIEVESWPAFSDPETTESGVVIRSLW